MIAWRLTTNEKLHWRHFGNQSVVFNPASGDTHLLDLVAREGLASLADGPASGEAICQQMAARLEIAHDDELRQYVFQLLKQMLEYGLVEKIET